MHDWVYLNNAMLPYAQAALSPRDRGFRFGDGVFETIPFFKGRPYQWGFHMTRMQEGLKALRISCERDWQSFAAELIEKNAMTEGFIRISISRGVGSRGYRPLPECEPTVFIETLPRGNSLTSATLWLSSWRKPAPESLPTSYKTAQGLNSILALQEADVQGCDEALLLSSEGHLCEAASGNLFWIADDTLFTPALETGCLNGATRHAIIRLSESPVQSVSQPIETLEHADAVFLTNSNWGILTVTAIKPNGWRWPTEHPLMDTLRTALQRDIHASV